MVTEGEISSRRYALLLAVNDSEYVKKAYGGYYNVYVEAFGEEGDTWDLFRVYDGDFPDFSDLNKYHGFVITGSPSDAYGNDYWILKLCFMLQTLDAMQKKVLGICFGHQVYMFSISTLRPSLYHVEFNAYWLIDHINYILRVYIS